MKDLHFMRIGVFQAIAFTIAQAVAIALAFLRYGLYAIVIGNILNILLQNAILRISSIYKPKFFISKKDVKNIISFGGWLTLSRLTGTIYSQIDKLLMSRWFSVIELGNFYRSKALIDIADSQVGGIFDVALFPILSNIQDNKEAIQSAYKKCIYMGCVIFSLLFVFFFFNAKLIILCFLGEKWLDQLPLFRFLTVSMLFFAFSRLADCFIRSLAYVKFGFFIKLLSCFILVPCIFLFKNQGVIGVAIAVISVNFAISIVKTIFICYKTKTNFADIIINAVRGSICSFPLIFIGVVFLLFFDKTISYSVAFFFLFVIVTILIFVLFPNLVGKTYKNQVFPLIRNQVSSHILSFRKER